MEKFLAGVEKLVDLAKIRVKDGKRKVGAERAKGAKEATGAKGA